MDFDGNTQFELNWHLIGHCTPTLNWEVEYLEECEGFANDDLFDYGS